MAFLDNFEEEQIIAKAKESKSMSELLTKLGVSPNSGQHMIRVSQYCKDHNIDLSHFRQNKHYRSDNEIFIKDSPVSRKVMRDRYIKGNYSPYKCSICGQEPFWNGKELGLILDHINGHNRDNRLENLRWICPNCDRQLPTFCGGNIPSEYKKEIKEMYCQKCGSRIYSNSITGVCWECWQKLSSKEKEQISPKIDYKNRTALQKHDQLVSNNTKVCPLCNGVKEKKAVMCRNCRDEENRKEYLQIKEEKYGITREKIKKLLREKTMTQIGRLYGVRNTTVMRWCEAYNLPSKFTDIQNYTDEEWEKI